MANETYHLPVRPYPRIWRRLLRWLQRKCRHYTLKADILEGCGGVYAVRWCETCGAVFVVVDGTPDSGRDCQPTWEPNHSRVRNWLDHQPEPTR